MWSVRVRVPVLSAGAEARLGAGVRAQPRLRKGVAGAVPGHGLPSNLGQLLEGRDLAPATDFRDVLAEVLVHHLGTRQTVAIFPGFAASPSRIRGFLG